MKKTVLTYGIIAGLIVSAWLQIGILIGMENMAGDMGIVYGYTAMLIGFSFIFVAVKREREQQGGITFGKAFLIGLYVSLIGATLYVISWMIDMHYFVPDFMDQYASRMMEQLKNSGASAAKIQETAAQMQYYREMYKNPFFVVLLTYMEILPVGLLVSLIAALILKRKTVNTTE